MEDGVQPNITGKILSNAQDENVNVRWLEEPCGGQQTFSVRDCSTCRQTIQHEALA
jgi:hypothetical protein